MSDQSHLIEKLKSQGITHPQVLKAISKVAREKFVLASYEGRAYENTALPIACQQTISQPYIVALMTQTLLEQHPGAKKILEIGTGSGYQCAILAEIFKEIWTIERIGALYEKAKNKLSALNYQNIHFQLSDGYQGWSEAAPFDGIIVTAAAKQLPPKLVFQLNSNLGVMVIPIGAQNKVQQLTIIKKQGDKIHTEIIERVSFVPLIRKAP